MGVNLGGNFPSGNCPGGSYPWWEFSRWKLSGWKLSRVGIFFGGSFPGGNCPVGVIRVAIFLGGVFMLPQSLFLNLNTAYSELTKIRFYLKT